MSAKHDILGQIQEMYDVILQTCEQMDELSFTRERFLSPQTTEDDLIAEGILNRVLRIAEEVGHVEEDIARRYGFDRAGASGVRNRLAHAYGEVDRELIWGVIEGDFDGLVAACRMYCDDHGIELRRSV